MVAGATLQLRFPVFGPVNGRRPGACHLVLTRAAVGGPEANTPPSRKLLPLATIAEKAIPHKDAKTKDREVERQRETMDRDDRHSGRKTEGQRGRETEGQ